MEINELHRIKAESKKNAEKLVIEITKAIYAKKDIGYKLLGFTRGSKDTITGSMIFQNKAGEYLEVNVKERTYFDGDCGVTLYFTNGRIEIYIFDKEYKYEGNISNVEKFHLFSVDDIYLNDYDIIVDPTDWETV